MSHILSRQTFREESLGTRAGIGEWLLDMLLARPGEHDCNLARAGASA